MSNSRRSEKQITVAAKSLCRQIEEALLGPTAEASYIARYVGALGHEKRKKDEQSLLTFWGFKVPVLRQLAKRPWIAHGFGTASEHISALPLETQWKLWRSAWANTEIYDVKNIIIMHLASKKFAQTRHEFASDLFSLAPEIDNWAHSDTLSEMLADILEHDRGHLKWYKRANSSANPWLRRQSIVGIYCYARLRKKHLPAKVALSLVKPLLEDQHFYVQRGVGWTLREIDRVDSNIQRAFVRKHLDRISGTAWFATSELYPMTLRRELVAIRGDGRRRK